RTIPWRGISVFGTLRLLPAGSSQSRKTPREREISYLHFTAHLILNKFHIIDKISTRCEARNIKRCFAGFCFVCVYYFAKRVVQVKYLTLFCIFNKYLFASGVRIYI